MNAADSKAAESKARGSGATIALDVHAHLAPIIPERLASLPGVSWRAQDEQLVVDGHVVGIKNLFRPAALLRWMDEHRVERAWVSVPPPLYRQQLDDESARAWAGYLNDGLEQVCAAYPRRFAPLFHVPLEHPAVAAEVASACIAKGARRFAAPAGGQTSLCLSDPALTPLWSRLDACEAFLFLHPGSCCDGRLAAFYLENLVGNPYETAVAAAHLVLGGVCERFARIRFCLAHAGGALPMLAGRLQHGYATDRPGIDKTLAPPTEILRRFLIDCIAHDPKALELAAAVVGERHVLFGSDWPFPMGLPDPHAQLAGLAPALRQGVLGGNATALGLHREQGRT